MYRERPSTLDGAVVWSRTPSGTGTEYPVLPDGCMDLLWTEGRLFVAGPDTQAHAPGDIPGRIAGVRFAPGTGPGVLGVPAYELLDRRVELADLWPAAETRRLTGRIDASPDPVAALEAVALGRAVPADPLIRTVAAHLSAGRPVNATADTVGLSARQLHRRALHAFGYGPKTLARILRLQRALALAATGMPYAEVAVAAGCADQAHLAREMRDLAGMTLGRYASLAANSDTSPPSGSHTVA
ncbi:helix-turn-helix transcriptional regulator [Streptomyces beijiangensis]|uniref:Helix-turn-helix transcriptional regulator n=1 Tax=Streptomyces beijiangensis TaxID=163361 RepID=A0A939F3Z0_9ACTN|nr:AraC family transcriptional regulator [Streptomyces beijiangensis]MBO0511436.1 helix-turn-helix transcriptional regulator [Streptomyces beijiangensis]